MPRLAAACSALLCLALAAPAGAAATRQIDPPALHEIGMKPWGEIRDNIVEKPATARAAQSSNIYTTGDGHKVRVIVSPSYQPNPEADRQYVDFVAGLVHGPELDGLTMVVAPSAEITALCEDPASLACYEANREVIYIPGEEFGEGGPSLASVLAHEYGHHVARNRSNAPWLAFHWGPKYWSSHMDICGRAARGEASPGDEGSRYSFNPGEAWAEAYVMVNGGPWSGIVDASLQPDAEGVSQARRDVLNPWPGNRNLVRRLRLRAGKRWANAFTLLDGNITFYASGPRGARYRATLYDAPGGRVLARRTLSRPGRAFKYTACGLDRAFVELRVLRGRGAFRVMLSKP